MYKFEYDYENPEDEADTAFAQRTLHNEANLDELVNAMRDFLQSAGFNYVEAVQVVTDDDRVVSST